MGARIARTKKFIKDNRVEIAFCAGAAVAVTTVVVVLRVNTPDLTKKLFVTAENLQKLIDNPDLAMRFDMSPKERIFVINGMMPTS